MAAKSSKGKKNTHRKLTAILSADVAGYSRLMGDDEEATVATLTAYRKVFVSEIENHHGRVVDAKGDAILAEFASVVDAVNGAVEIQRELAGKNADLSDERRMDFRIGINLGDVVVKDDAIYGDGVNVAARLEALAEPGGVCISRSAYDQVKNKLKLEYEYLGEQQVKNIADPVRAYKVLTDQEDAAHRGVQARPEAGGKATALELPDVPSLAVLAFENLSSEQEQEYFGDGISEDIITDLARIGGLLVIGRSSSFVYKGRKVDLRQIGRELGVRYVLEGSVRKVGNRVRVTAQLVDAETGHHVWAERYDKHLDDTFLVGDEITEEIVTAMDVKLVMGQQAIIFRRAMKTTKGREYYNGGYQFTTLGTKEGMLRAAEMMELARKEEPENAAPYGFGAYLLGLTAMRGMSEDPSATFEQSERLAIRGLELDSYNPAAHGALGLLHLVRGNHDQALAKCTEAASYKEVCSGPKSLLALVNLYSGYPADAICFIEEAMRLTPFYPDDFLYILGLAQYLCGEIKGAEASARAIQKRNPEHMGSHILMACVAGSTGRAQEARAAGESILKINPRFTLSSYGLVPPFKDQVVREGILDALRQAGLPE